MGVEVGVAVGVGVGAEVGVSIGVRVEIIVAVGVVDTHSDGAAPAQPETRAMNAPSHMSLLRRR
jgi:hypothetical protein